MYRVRTVSVPYLRHQTPVHSIVQDLVYLNAASTRDIAWCVFELSLLWLVVALYRMYSVLKVTDVTQGILEVQGPSEVEASLTGMCRLF
jgi:hypothetical protein